MTDDVKRDVVNGAPCLALKTGTEIYLTENGDLFLDDPIDDEDCVTIPADDVRWLLSGGESAPVPPAKPDVAAGEVTEATDSVLDEPGICATRRNVVTRALEFAAHGHGELPAGFMSDAVDCLAGVLRDSERVMLERVADAEARGFADGQAVVKAPHNERARALVGAEQMVIASALANAEERGRESMARPLVTHPPYVSDDEIAEVAKLADEAIVALRTPSSSSAPVVRWLRWQEDRGLFVFRELLKRAKTGGKALGELREWLERRANDAEFSGGERAGYGRAVRKLDLLVLCERNESGGRDV